MKTFNDKDGRVWQISITLGSAIKVKEALDIDLLQPESGDPPVITRLGTDEFLLARVICVLIQDQFEKHNVDEDAIYNSMDGDTVLQAQTAFYDELIDFFQQRGRQDRATAVAKQAEMITAAVKQVTEKVSSIDTEEMIRGAISGSLPELSE